MNLLKITKRDNLNKNQEMLIHCLLRADSADFRTESRQHLSGDYRRVIGDGASNTADDY